MPDTVPAAEVRDLIAAIRDALDPPNPSRYDGWQTRSELLARRADYMLGVLEALAGGNPFSGSETKVLRRIGDVYPVTYEINQAAGEGEGE